MNSKKSPFPQDDISYTKDQLLEALQLNSIYEEQKKKSPIKLLDNKIELKFHNFGAAAYWEGDFKNNKIMINIDHEYPHSYNSIAINREDTLNSHQIHINGNLSIEDAVVIIERIISKYYCV